MQSLIVIEGSRHTPYTLTEPLVRIGQHPGNSLVIEDPEVSAYHCRLERSAAGTWTITDARSTNGTFVNEALIEVAELRPGDRIRLGQTVILFVERGSKGTGDRLQNLLILQEVNKVLNSQTHLPRLLELIMDLAIQLTEAERGFLVLIRGQRRIFKVARNIDFEEVQHPRFKISSSVISKVVQTGRPVLTSNAQADLASYQSIITQDVRSLLCVPLTIKKRILGTLYVDSQAQNSVFTDNDRELLAAFSDQAAIAIENARLLEQARLTAAMRSELKVAARIQSALLPTSPPAIPGLAVAGLLSNAKEVGGDYFDYIPGPQGGWTIAIGDVSGKGVPAGLVMVMARSTLRSLIAADDAPRPLRGLLTEVNRILKPDLKPGMFMSMLLARYDPARAVVTLCGCGHEPPLVFRAADGGVEALDVGGIVLGVLDDIAEITAELEVSLAPGDHLILYTDGLTEAMNSQGAQFGLERLEDCLRRRGPERPEDLIAGLFADVAFHRHQAEQNDDLTIIALKRPAKDSAPELEAAKDAFETRDDEPGLGGAGEAAPQP